MGKAADVKQGGCTRGAAAGIGAEQSRGGGEKGQKARGRAGGARGSEKTGGKT